MKLKPIDWIWFACIAISIAVGIFSFYLQLPLKNDGILYLLSTTSQALAAIFALVFTITLVSAQIAQKYNATDKFFNRRTYFLMAMYIIGIILPILLLKMDNDTKFYNFFVSLSVGLAAFCIAAIIPYLKKCNDIIKFEIGVSNLIDELIEAEISEKFSKANSVVYELSEIAKSAIQEKMEKPVHMINIGISNLIQTAIPKQEGKILPTFSSYYPIEVLSEIGINATIAHLDNVAWPITQSIRECGKLMINNNFRDGSAEKAINTLKQIGIKAINLKLKETSIQSLISLLVLANEANSKGNWEDEYEKAYNCFGICIAHFEKHFPEQIDALCNEIKSMGIDINKDLLNKTKDIISKQYPDVNGFLDIYIKRFET